MPSWQPPGQPSPQYGDPEAEQEMGKKIQYIGRYVMDARTLGKGNFARVELATHGVTQIKVAIKVIDTRKIKEDYVRQNLHREARIMAQLRHPNIIRLYETLKATTLYCLVMEYASSGELLTYIKEQKDSRLGESAARPYFRQLLSALQYLHERGVVHRDLKMENILLDEKKKNIKLVDFGLSNVYSADQPLKTHCGSPEYAAPELFQTGRTYGPEIDIWSLGIITYAMIIGKLPFVMHMTDNYHRQKLLQAIQKGLSKQHEREMQHLTSDCRSLIQHLIEPTPGLRYKIPDIMTHLWVTKQGKMPFAPFQPPLKDKHLRSQIVVELAELMQMEKKAVSESVKENRADELSSMFNMLIDQKKRQKGLFDIDHTLKRAEPKTTVAPKMRALGAKGKTDQPNLVKRSAANKLNVPKEVHMMPPTVQERSTDQPDTSSSKPPTASLRPESAQCDPSKRPTTQNTTTGPSTRIPKRQQTPTHKLNLTLDLSVVNVPASSRTESPRRSQGARSSGSSLTRSRVQSPSKIPLPSPGVDSQSSPNDDSSHSSRRKRGTCLPLPRPSRPSRPSRPTSLNFRGNKAIPNTKPPPFQGKGAAVVNESPLIAPKATPEDTAVTSSASDTNLDSMQCDMLNASDDEKLEKLEQLKHALLGGCIPRQSTGDMVCDEASRTPGAASDTHVAERTHKPLARQLATVRNATAAVAKPCWYPPSKEVTSQRQCENTSGDTLNDSQTDNTLILPPKAKDRSNSNAQYSEANTVEVSRNIPPLKRGQSENANSGLPNYKDCVVHVCENNSPPRYSECVEPTVVETQGLEAISDIREVSNTPEGMSSAEATSATASPKTAQRCTTCGSHLPQRPHKLFTSGAHALDMFVSPEEISPTGWESEGGATTERGSPMQAAPLLRDSPSQLRNKTPSQLTSHLPNVANKSLMQVPTPPTTPKSAAKSYSDASLAPDMSSPKKSPINKSKEMKEKPSSPKKAGNRWSLPPQSPTKQGNPRPGHQRSNTLSGIRYRFSSSADRSKQLQRNNVYTNVPDKSLRLEPVGAESDIAHAEPATGNHVTAHNNSNHGTIKNGKRAPSLSSEPCRALSCDSTSPNRSSNSQKSTPSNSSHVVGRELSPPHSPQKSNATPKWLVMKQYDQQRKSTSWRQGLSHLLRRAKPNGAPSSKEMTGDDNKPNNAANRRSRAKTREVYYKQLEAKWTAPASPTHTHSTHNSMEVTSSPVPSTSPSPQQHYFDITATTHSEPQSQRRIKSSPCKDCGKTERAILEQSHDEILSLDTKLKLECSIDSAIHKSLTLSNSLSSRLPLRHHKVAQQATPNSNPATKRNS